MGTFPDWRGEQKYFNPPARGTKRFFLNSVAPQKNPLTFARIILNAFLFLAASTTSSQPADSTAFLEEALIEADTVRRKTEFQEIEIGQLIIDNTFSKAGNDFQQIFNTLWNWPLHDGEEFIITIGERPSFSNATLIEVRVNDLKVFERFLQPRYDAVEETATQAMDLTLQYILNYEEIVKELNGEDLSGSGIY